MRSWTVCVMGVAMAATGLVARGSGSIALKTFKYDIIEGFYACLIGAVLLDVMPWLNAVLRARPLRFVGRVSYGLYVFHPLAFLWMFHELAGVPWIVRGPAGYLVALAMAVVSWYGYERYFIRLKDRFAPEPRATPHAPVSI